jgi:hypothetical protein
MVKCNTINCDKIAVYGYLINKVKLACAEHKISTNENKMYNLYYTYCQCGIRASFGIINEKPLCCKKCKTNNMIDLTNINRLCPCGTIPSFGLELDKKPSCCSKCKTENMIYIIKKNCQCGIRPSFGFINDKKPLCCAKCKKEGMINLTCINRLCKCGKQPSFGLVNDNKPNYCVNCKTDDMIDLKNKKCLCGIQPYFGLPDDKVATCCSKCKSDNMIDIVSKKCTCSNSHPTFGYIDDNIRLCCIKCKTKDMINLVSPKCIATDKDGKTYCATFGNSKYDGYCTHCFANLFPLDPRTPNIRIKTKEIAVRNFINNNFDGFEHDHPLWVNGCDCTHKRRIDHRKVINETLLATETDEFQHKPYDKQDEIIRYDDLIMVHGGKSIFIRFNPDSYRDNGILMNPPMEERLEVLKKEIEKQIKRIENNENTEFIEIIYMYYDK